MATNNDGTEFHLADVRAVARDTDLERIRHVFATLVREGDGVFVWEERVFLAIVADLSGSSLALRRLIKQARDKGLEVRIRLIPEPFSLELANAASQVILGDVTVTRRVVFREKPWI